MIEIQSSSDLAVGDEVQVREYSCTGAHPLRRGVVTHVGKAHARVMYSNGIAENVRYGKKISVRVFRRLESRIFRPLHKLSELDLWREQAPQTDRIWCDGYGADGPTLIVRREAARDELDDVIDDLRAYSEWLRREPKKES